MNKPIKIACIGEVMIELIAGNDDQATIGFAGDTYNTAVYLAKLNSNTKLHISYVTALGTDRFSERIVKEMQSHEIDHSLIEFRDDKMPGLYAIETDKNGERSFAYWRGQSAARTLFEEPCKINLNQLLNFDYIYLSGISVAILSPATRERLIDFLKLFKSHGGKLVFDSNYRPRLWENKETARSVTQSMWSITDIALPSLDDELELFNAANEEDVINRLRKLGIEFGALKRGQNGPLAIANTQLNSACFAPVTTVVDSTAAGDSFNAGFLSEIAFGGTFESAARKGHDLAAKVIQKRGAIVALED